MPRFLFLFIFLPTFFSVFSQKNLPPAIILAKNAAEPEQRAAKILQFYLKKITAADVPILSGSRTPNDRAPIFLGKNDLLEKWGIQVPLVMPADAFLIKSGAGSAVIFGGGEMGTEYGVYTFLEKLGCRKFTPRDSFIPEIKDFRLPEILQKLEIPAFPYRELHYQNAFDESWARWHKLKTNPKKEEEWGLFVHTFEKLCPPAEYFAEHPEFFSWNGKQRSAGQLCLSNDTVRQIVIENLGKKILENPRAKYWSVSQNDNFDFCHCPRCAASDKKHGSPAGTLLEFVNAVAAAFPEKIISTLAYQYTREAPVGIRPAANVSVCLCSIECNRGLPLADDPTSAGFVRDVENWSKLTENLMIWDYVVQFRDYLSPFPNWHTLQPNLQFFQKNYAKMVFEQGSGRSRSEFSDMRAYILAKLMWNPSANMDSILTDFGRGFYGKRLQPIIWDYIDSLTVRLLETDKTLQIYGTPLVPAKSWMTEKDVNAYFSIFERGVMLVTDDSTREAEQLSEAMLPMVHTLLEQFKIRDWGYPQRDPARSGKFRYEYLPAHHNMVNGWPELCQKFGYETMNENNYTPEKYAEDMQKYFAEGRVWHSFLLVPDGQQILRQDWPTVGSQTKTEVTGQKISVSLENPPSKIYENGNPEILLDSRRGTTDYRWNWLGFQGNDLVATVRQPDSLKNENLPEVSFVSVQFLQDQASWVFFPEKVILEISEDGQKFQKIREERIQIVPDGEKKVRRITAKFSSTKKIRAVRLTAVNQKTCPSWHTCNGNPCWIFVDEIVVD